MKSMINRRPFSNRSCAHFIITFNYVDSVIVSSWDTAAAAVFSSSDSGSDYTSEHNSYNSDADFRPANHFSKVLYARPKQQPKQRQQPMHIPMQAPVTKPTESMAPTTAPTTATRTTKPTMTATTTVIIMAVILFDLNRPPPTCYQRHHPPV